MGGRCQIGEPDRPSGVGHKGQVSGSVVVAILAADATPQAVLGSDKIRHGPGRSVASGRMIGVHRGGAAFSTVPDQENGSAKRIDRSADEMGSAAAGCRVSSEDRSRSTTCCREGYEQHDKVVRKTL